MFPNSKRGGLLSRAAMAAALALGAVGGAAVFAAPAVAKEAKGSNSPDFVKVAGPLQKDVQELVGKVGKAPEPQLKAAAVALAPRLAALEPVMKTPLDKSTGGQWMYQIGAIAGDDVLSSKGLDAMLSSGMLDAATEAKVKTMRGQNAYLSKDYAKAIELLGPVAAQPGVDDAVPQMLAESYAATGNVAQATAALKGAIEARKAAGAAVPEVLIGRGLAIAYRAKSNDMAFYFASQLAANYPTKSNWGDAIATARNMGKFQAQETLDLMRLVSRTDSFRDSGDYAEYLQAADARRSPGEVLKVLNAGVAAGKLSASDVFVTDNKSQATARLAADKAGLPALERDAMAPSASGVTVNAAADAFLSYDQPAKAEALYRVALTKPGVDADRVNTRLGIALADQGKYADAQAAFAKVGGLRKPIADLWAIYAAQKARGA